MSAHRQAQLHGESRPFNKATSVVGIDGCRSGWVGVFIRATEVDIAHRNYQAGQSGVELAFTPKLEAWLPRLAGAWVFLDQPIGLPGLSRPYREVDRQARQKLGKAGRGRVFSPPSREVLGLSSHAEASAAQKRASGVGISIQAWNLAPKLREVDMLAQRHRELFPRGWQDAPGIYEAHPELMMAGLRGGLPVAESKRTAHGQRIREETLESFRRGIIEDLRSQRQAFSGKVMAWDDVIDAAILAIAAEVWNHDAERRGILPAGEGPVDEAGLPMQMVWLRGG